MIYKFIIYRYKSKDTKINCKWNKDKLLVEYIRYYKKSYELYDISNDILDLNYFSLNEFEYQIFNANGKIGYLL